MCMHTNCAHAHMQYTTCACAVGPFYLFCLFIYLALCAVRGWMRAPEALPPGDGARLPAGLLHTGGTGTGRTSVGTALHSGASTAGPPSTPLPPSGPPLGNSLRLSGPLSHSPPIQHPSLSSGLTHGPRSKRGTSCSCSHPCPVSPALASIVEVLIDSRPGSSCCPHAPGPDGARTRR